MQHRTMRAIWPLAVATLILCAGPATGQTEVDDDHADSLSGVEANEGEHPRLFITPRRIAALRDAVGEGGSFHQRAYEQIKQRVDRNDWRDYAGPANNARAALAREAALVYQISTDTHYAELAYQALMAIENSPRERGQLTEGEGVDRAAVGMGFAIVYDWCHPGWSDEQRDEVRALIAGGLDAWETYGHGNFGGEMVSHWVPVCRGAELIMMLATFEETERPERFARIKRWLAEHLTQAYGPTGISQEGVAMVAEAGRYLIPAALALRDVGDRSLDAAFDRRAWWRLAMYTGSNAIDPDGGRRYLPTGIAPPTLRPIGWASLLMPTVPAEHRGHYHHFYARHVGLKSAGDDVQRFDDGRAGAVWALLYRPVDMPETNPAAQMPRSFVDRQRGLMLFRNAWQDDDDVLVTINADAVAQPRAWNQAEALSIGVIGFGNAFIGGPGKQAASRYFSTLLVDGEHRDPAGVDEATGHAPLLAATEHGGYAIVEGGRQYAALGIESVERHFLVDFANTSGTAMLATLDRIQSAEEHQYAWQINVGDDVSDTALKLTDGREAGRRTFTLTGQNGGYLKAWVMTPRDATLEIDDPLRINTRNTITDIWVVMLVGRGEPPTATIDGEGLDATIIVDGATLRYDRNTGRMIRE